MFGYITINQNELKIKDYKRYRSFYCGLCHSLKKRCGLKGQMLLPNDLTFADVLLNAYLEEPLEETDERCVLHPVKKQHMVFNRVTDYCADMGILLAYYKMLDDVRDDGSLKAKAYAATLKKPVRKIRTAYPRQTKAVEHYILQLGEYEKDRVYDLDAVAGLTGSVIGEIFVFREDLWSDIFRKMGFYLGKFIYLLDAYDDLERDLKSGNYNPWEPYRSRRDFEALVENTLTMMMAASAREFEKLPIVQDVNILRNIMYSGVWVKFREIQKKRNPEMEEETI